MKVGIFGPLGSGKTTVFNCLTGLKAETGFGKTKQNLGSVKVPDDRVDYLASVYHPKKTTYAEILFVDLPGASGKGVDAQAAGELRSVDVLTVVVAAFDSPMSESGPDPKGDFERIESELLLWDFAVVEKRLERMAKERSKDSTLEREILEKCLVTLEEERPLRLMDWTDQQEQLLRGYQFLSRKRLIVLVNTPDDAPNEVVSGLEDEAREHGASVISMSAQVEAEILDLAPEERADFLADLGQSMSGRDRYIRHAYEALDLISFLTAGEDECRAWTIRRGTVARKAAGVIHSDIERGFIRAEVVSFEDFKAFGGEDAAKAAGKYRLEGKDYVVADGDIINFRFNV